MPPWPMIGMPSGRATCATCNHLEERDRLIAGPTARPARCYDGLARPDVDRHAHDRVDHGEAVAACLDAAARVLLDVGLVGRELVMIALSRRGRPPPRVPTSPARCRTARRFLDVRAGDVDLDGVDGLSRRSGAWSRRSPRWSSADVGEEPRLAEVERREDPSTTRSTPGSAGRSRSACPSASRTRGAAGCRGAARASCP